jgi:hypothetical protein
MSITSEPDHVAVAVPSIEEAGRRWHGHLGGAWCSPKHSAGPGFATQHLRYRGAGKLELLEPEGDDGFAARFLQRFGARVHHVTLMVSELEPAVEAVREAGYDVVDVSTEDDEWHEGFLRPTQVGGVVVQLARSLRSTEEWSEEMGFDVEPIPTTGPALRGPTLFHHDLAAAVRVWSVLGGTVEQTDEAVTVRWAAAPLSVRIEHRDHPVSPVLRFDGAPTLAGDPELGPAVVPDPDRRVGQAPSGSDRAAR